MVVLSEMPAVFLTASFMQVAIHVQRSIMQRGAELTSRVKPHKRSTVYTLFTIGRYEVFAFFVHFSRNCIDPCRIRE